MKKIRKSQREFLKRQQTSIMKKIYSNLEIQERLLTGLRNLIL